MREGFRVWNRYWLSCNFLFFSSMLYLLPKCISCDRVTWIKITYKKWFQIEKCSSIDWLSKVILQLTLTLFFLLTKQILIQVLADLQIPLKELYPNWPTSFQNNLPVNIYVFLIYSHNVNKMFFLSSFYHILNEILHMKKKQSTFSSNTGRDYMDHQQLFIDALPYTYQI